MIAELCVQKKTEKGLINCEPVYYESLVAAVKAAESFALNPNIRRIVVRKMEADESGMLVPGSLCYEHKKDTKEEGESYSTLKKTPIKKMHSGVFDYSGDDICCKNCVNCRENKGKNSKRTSFWCEYPNEKLKDNLRKKHKIKSEKYLIGYSRMYENEPKIIGAPRWCPRKFMEEGK